jgi:hypothetical protein
VEKWIKGKINALNGMLLHLSTFYSAQKAQVSCEPSSCFDVLDLPRVREDSRFLAYISRY